MPVMVIAVSGEPTTIELGVTEEITGVDKPEPITSAAAGETPPPGAGFITVTWKVAETA